MIRRHQCRPFVETIARSIWAGFSQASRLDQLNFVLGVLGVVLMVRRSLWAFPVGLAAVTIQAALFFQARFYADAALQGFFFAALAWGWWHWVHDRGAAPELPVTALSWRQRMISVVAGGVAMTAWALALQRWTDAAMPWRDSLIAAFSVVAQVLQVRKKIENWPFWVGVNVVALATYWTASLAYTAFLYGIYLVLALAGWWSWSRALRR